MNSFIKDACFSFPMPNVCLIIGGVMSSSFLSHAILISYQFFGIEKLTSFPISIFCWISDMLRKKGCVLFYTSERFKTTSSKKSVNLKKQYIHFTSYQPLLKKILSALLHPSTTNRLKTEHRAHFFSTVRLSALVFRQHCILLKF